MKIQTAKKQQLLILCVLCHGHQVPLGVLYLQL